MLENVLQVLHHDILPNFDSGQAPGIFTIAKIASIAWKLRGQAAALETREFRVIKDIIYALPQIMRVMHTNQQFDANDPITSVIAIIEDNKDELFDHASKIPGPDKDVVFSEIRAKICNLTITNAPQPPGDDEFIALLSKHLRLETLMPKHPLVYELMEMTNQLIKAAPDQLEDLIPFFDPQATVKPLQSGILATLLSKFGSFHIKLLERETDQGNPYAFEASLNGADRSFDAKERYSEWRHNMSHSILPPLLTQYLAVYGELHSQQYPLAHDAISQGKAQEQTRAANSLLEVQWQKECSTNMQSLANFNDELNALLTTPAPEQAPTLEDALKLILVKLDTHVTLRQKVMTLIQTAQESMRSISNDELRPVLEERFSTIQNAASMLLDALTASEQALNQEQIALRAQSEKRNAEQRFAESLRSADPEKIQQLLDEQNRELAALQEECQVLSARETALQNNISLLRAKQEDVVVQERKKQAKLIDIHKQLDGLQANINVLSQSIATETSQAMQDYPDLLERLCLIKAKLESGENQNKIPFKQIDIFIPFDQLLPLLSEYLNSEDCKRYRESQEGAFKRSPSRDDFISMKAALLSALDKKILAIDDGYLQIIEKIEQNTSLRKTTDATATQLEYELASLHSQSQDIALALLQHEEESADITDALHRLSSQKESPLKSTQYLLSQFLIMLTETDQLKLRIDSFAKNDHYENLSDQILEIQNTAAHLTTQTKALAGVIDTLVNPLEYQPTLEIIRQLLQQIEQRILLVAEEKRTRWQASLPPLVIPTILISEEDAETTENSSAANPKAERQTMAHVLIVALRNYQTKRAAQYKAKDFFTAADKSARDLFITQLETQLLAYAETGNSDEVLQTIREQLKLFPGRSLQPLLYKITAEILSFGQESVANSQQVDERLTALEQTQLQYVIIHRDLLQKISDMRNYGVTRNNPVIIELADKLKQDVAFFILSHPEKLPSNAAFQAFNRKFHARLHSEDHVMLAEGKNWTHIVANIALILFLIPKMMYSKVTTGRCSFFFEETKATDFVALIEEEEAKLESQVCGQ